MSGPLGTHIFVLHDHSTHSEVAKNCKKIWNVGTIWKSINPEELNNSGSQAWSVKILHHPESTKTQRERKSPCIERFMVHPKAWLDFNNSIDGFYENKPQIILPEKKGNLVKFRIQNI